MPFERVLYYGKYDGVLKEAIHQYKFNKVRRLSKPLAMLLQELPFPDSDAIVVVPLHTKRLREREFNQTALLGRYLSKKIKIPLLLDALIKIKETRPQTGLSSEERLRNLKNAFVARDIVKGLNLLLIDDVITTGTTIKECSKALQKAGARGITVLALARAFKDT
jgi:ComF family protein